VVLVAGTAVVAAPAAAADPTGTGGQFVPLQARLVDTRTGTGGFTGPMPAGTFETFAVSGQAGLPSTGVAAVVASVTAINGTGSAGTVTTGANSGGSAGTVTALQFGAGDTVSNTVVIENGDDGKIKISASQSVQILLDIQGYFTAGNGNPAPGGFVPLPAGNVTTIASPAASSTSTVQVTGVAGVPATATAVFANLTVDNTGPGSVNSWVIPFPTGTTVPATSLNYDAASVTAIGTTVDLNAQGQLSIKFDVAAPVSVRVDVLGYFDGQPSNAGFTPVTGRVFDSGVSPNVNIPAGGTVDVPVNGVAGLPAWSASISGVALNVQTSGSAAAGSVTVWSTDESMLAAATVDGEANST
jgi:hypothetical protein